MVFQGKDVLSCYSQRLLGQPMEMGTKKNLLDAEGRDISNEVYAELKRELSLPHDTQCQDNKDIMLTFAYAMGTDTRPCYAKFDIRDEVCLRVGRFKHGQIVYDHAGHEFIVVGVKPFRGTPRLWLQPQVLGRVGSVPFEGNPTTALHTKGATKHLCETSLNDFDAAEDSDEEEVQLCKQCHLPLGDVAYNGKDGTVLHGECLAQFHVRGLNEEIAARKQKSMALKSARDAEYQIGWKAERIPSNVGPFTKLECKVAPEGMCCLVLDEKSGSVRVSLTTEPTAAMNLEYLSLALRARCHDGMEPFFSLDPVDTTGLPEGHEALMQEKRFEPEWLAGTSMGEVLFQADYHLKQLSMGEYEQPVIGMKSCFDLFSESGCQEKDWSAREWFVVRQADVLMSEDNVLLPYIKMGVEARELIDGTEDAPITRPDHALVKYAKDFTHNFDLIAERKSVIHQLREVARATVLAKYLLESEVNLEDSWFHLAGKESDACCMEVPKLWSERFASQLHVQDGKIEEAEKGVRPHTRGVYGGVQFGISQFQLKPRAGAGLDRFRVASQLAVPGPSETAPRWSMVFSSNTAAGLRKPIMTTLRSNIISVSPGGGLRGVDLNLNQFDLSEATHTTGIWAGKLESPQAHCPISSAFWSSIDNGAKTVFKDEDAKLFRDIFNPIISDRRDEGDLFVPPATSTSHMQQLRKLVKEERAVREERKQHFFSKKFMEDSTGSLFPSSWQSSFQIACSSEQERGLLHPRPDYKAQAAVFDNLLQSAEAAFDKSTEDGVRFRIYRLGGLEVRTTQEICGKEIVGAVFSVRTPLEASMEGKRGQSPGEQEQVIKATEYIERAGNVELHRSYVVLETDKGNIILTEKLADGTATWEENPKALEVRNALAKVLRSVDCNIARITIRDMRAHQTRFHRPGNHVSTSKCKRYARGAFDRAQAAQVMASDKKTSA